jgi:hypothetical protein
MKEEKLLVAIDDHSSSLDAVTYVGKITDNPLALRYWYLGNSSRVPPAKHFLFLWIRRVDS